ncbi:DUF493 family protein YbeD [Shewanella cyperi]|uniref:UPF0250 protein JYB88_13255 n=1 Tax=Shewanella cyperi TaxID=2814292 RepID=A0A975AJZ1_9GAMM|nr:DUF493 family protein YbeD [Shewanella cyperi]QSX29191.1 YbeD family protein [Shewanella cyperi]QSX39937.1 YbeD family protein [Shewanella cyperi]
MLNTTFDQYLEFPCSFPFKVVGDASDTLAERVVAVVQQHAPGDYSPSSKMSSKGSYLSVTVRVKVTSKEHIETLYIALAEVEGVRRVL